MNLKQKEKEIKEKYKNLRSLAEEVAERETDNVDMDDRERLVETVSFWKGNAFIFKDEERETMSQFLTCSDNWTNDETEFCIFNDDALSKGDINTYNLYAATLEEIKYWLDNELEAINDKEKEEIEELYS